MNAEDLLIWIDTETTGINPDSNLLLGLAIVITDNSLNELYRHNFIVDHDSDTIESHLIEFTRKMHTDNGLLADLASPDVDKITINELDKALCMIIEHYGIFAKGMLAGNSIHFDRGYIRQYLPAFEAKLNYRMLDVSAIAIAVTRGILTLPAPVKKYAHRAMDDIQESITELQGYHKQVSRL